MPINIRSQRIYIDTSVIGGFHDEEFAKWSRGLMEDFRRGHYRPVVSEIVDAEIQDAPEHIKRVYSELLASHHEFVEVTKEAVELAEAYLAREILTPKFADDALHIALATVADVDLLVSWNFRHIVHFDKIRQFSAVNLENGFKPLEIYSPREVTTYGNEEEL